MEFLFWIVDGLAAGWLTGKAMSADRRDLMMDALTGVVGGVAGGFLIQVAGLPVPGKMIYANRSRDSRRDCSYDAEPNRYSKTRHTPSPTGSASRMMRFSMPAKIMKGFPLRRCSWFVPPIVPDVLSRKMIRWLDVVCLKQATLKV